jgi:hypothetical protein
MELHSIELTLVVAGKPGIELERLQNTSPFASICIFSPKKTTERERAFSKVKLSLL